jgi:hypothetical protein
MEAYPRTVGEFFEELFPGRDIAAALRKVQTALETLANQISAGIERVCEVVDRLENLPPSPGYEPMLIQRGHHPLMARGLSYWLVGVSKDEAYKITTPRLVADTLRFLAKPG